MLEGGARNWPREDNPVYAINTNCIQCLFKHLAQINYFNKINNTPFVKKRYKKNQASTYSAYELSTKKLCFLIKGCPATIFFGPLIFQNIKTFWREIGIFDIQTAHPLTRKHRFLLIGTICTCLILFVALFDKGCFYFAKLIFICSFSYWISYI